jgi:hypothetical protein
VNDNDSDVLCAVRDKLAELPVPARPPLETIVARGRAARRHRRAGLAVASVTAGAALIVGLSGVIGPAGQAPARGAGRARLAAFTIVSNADGTTTLTMNNPGGLRDPNVVRQALAQHGIPAIVTVGELCTTRVPLNAPGAVALQGQSIVFNPAAMPSWLKVSIGYVPNGRAVEISVALIDTRSPLSCSSLPGGPALPSRVPLSPPA